ncbi:3'(2'),5'-bisphosphate nucleotidase [Planctomycetales bacterium ZRK34]|nr:3'(2'),5'-bisphosphate nucleotidase [Planctomycetales bacterium ZRK34]
MSHLYVKELETAEAAVAAASRICQAVAAQITPDVLEKKDRSPVTVADYASQAVICRALREAFPEDPIIAEEDSAALREPDQAELLAKVVKHVDAAVPGAVAEDVCGWIDYGGASEYSSRFWTLDPIDGTKGFLRKEQYAVALALIVDGEPTVAALACPNLNGGLVATAVRGHGAWARPMIVDEKPVAIAVSRTLDPAKARFCESVESGHSSHDHAAQIAEKLGITGEPLRMDSQAKYAAVAQGFADIYMRLPTRADYVEKIWDHAAGVLVCTEAGGKVTDITGKPLDFTHGRGLATNRGVIVTNGPLHDVLIQAIGAVGVS